MSGRLADYPGELACMLMKRGSAFLYIFLSLSDQPSFFSFASNYVLDQRKFEIKGEILYNLHKTK